MLQQRPDRVLGGPHDTFWMHCDDDELWMQQCETCALVQWPPAESCERCDSENIQWAHLSGHGQLVSWCTFERAYYKELSAPWETIVVELDEGPLFVSNPYGFSVSSAMLGKHVEVTFIDCEDSAGRFRLPVFSSCAPPMSA